MNPMVAFERLRDEAVAELTPNPGVVGIDLGACGPVTVPAQNWVTFNAAIAVYLPESIYGFLVVRSEFGERGLAVMSVVIDPSYTSELSVTLWNHTYAPIELEYGEKCVQLIIAGYVQVQVVEVPRGTFSRGPSGGPGQGGPPFDDDESMDDEKPGGDGPSGGSAAQDGATSNGRSSRKRPRDSEEAGSGDGGEASNGGSARKRLRDAEEADAVDDDDEAARAQSRDRVEASEVHGSPPASMNGEVPSEPIQLRRSERLRLKRQAEREQDTPATSIAPSSGSSGDSNVLMDGDDGSAMSDGRVVNAIRREEGEWVNRVAELEEQNRVLGDEFVVARQQVEAEQRVSALLRAQIEEANATLDVLRNDADEDGDRIQLLEDQLREVQQEHALCAEQHERLEGALLQIDELEDDVARGQRLVDQMRGVIVQRAGELRRVRAQADQRNIVIGRLTAEKDELTHITAGQRVQLQEAFERCRAQEERAVAAEGQYAIAQLALQALEENARIAEAPGV